MRAILCVVLVVAGVGAVRPASADDRAAAREHFLKGSKAFDLGLYDEAISEYMAAYKAKDDPALLYNIAQSHRLAGRPQEAIRFYKMFMAKLPRAQNRDEVEAKVAELQKLIEQQKRTQTMPPDQVKPLGSEPAHAETPTATTAPSQPTPTPPAAEPSPEAAPPPEAQPAPAAVDLSAGRTKKIAGLALAGAGIVLAAAGAALEGIAKSDSDALSAADRSGGVYDPSKQHEGETFNTVGAVLIGVGAAAAITGGVLAILGFREAKAARAQVVPTVSPKVAGVSLRLAF
jgi:tetratricopeptide (TPR) repeat protein